MSNQAAIAALFRVMNRYLGNLPSMPGVFPDYPAPLFRCFSMMLQASSASASVLKGEPPILMAPLRSSSGRHDAT